LTSYNATYAAEWGRKSRNLLESHGSRFGVKIDAASHAADRWNIDGHDGGMVTAGAGGTITGRGADLLICDDPIKNAEEAHSKLVRDQVWDWWTSTAYTRLEPNGAAIVIQTRWHQDDLCGRILKQAEDGGEQWRILKLPAIGSDGAALWPERYSTDDLKRIKSTIGSYYFSALYQQEPIPDGGEFIQRDWLPIVDEYPVGCRTVRYWDTANSMDGDWTVGVLMGESAGIYYVIDAARMQCSWKQRNDIIRQTAELDATKCRNHQLWVEAQRGDSGGQVADIFTREFAKFGLRMDRPNQDKMTRARPWQAQCEAGNVKLVRGKWNSAYIDVVVSFPHGEHDDDVDASSGAFNKLALSGNSGGGGMPVGRTSR
jgi:predicted phage terminase large subunit-like protein